MIDLSTIKAGDKIGLTNHSQTSIVSVSRVTATQIIIEGGARYNKKHGRKIGVDHYVSDWIISAEDAREKIDESCC